MEAGKIIEFFEEKRILCGICLENRGDRVRLLSETNREMAISRQRIIYSAPSPWDPQLPRQHLLTQLKAAAQRREDLKREIPLEELWELLVEDQQTYTLQELAETWFGAAVSPDQVAALARALYENRLFFKYKGGLWTPHNAETVENLREKCRRQQEREQELHTAAAWLKAAWEGREITDPAWRARLVEVLKDMTVFGPEGSHYQQGKEYLQRANLVKPEAPFRLLVALGVFAEDENLDLYRLDVPQDFPSPAQDAALALTRPENLFDPYAELRLDLTGEEIITIDGEHTRDFDDALSLKRVPGGWQLGVHISDVSSYVQSGDLLDTQALERGTSIYLPDQRIPMLPESLSENTLSLLAQEPRLALSFFAVLNEAAEVLDWHIVPSRIQVQRQLTYHQADQLLAQDDTLGALERLCRRLQERRLAQGGINLQLPEVMVNIDPEGQISVHLEDSETPSRQMVSEAMVLANWLAARFLAEHGVPAIYRVQPPPREELHREEAPTLLQLWKNRRRLSRVVLDLEPQPHWGLGLSAYTTISSPIRRYLDLIIHRQIYATLNGHFAMYSREQLESMLTLLDLALRRAGQLKTRRLRYWLLKYLGFRLGQKMPALVMDHLANRYRLLLTDILLEVELPAPPSLNLIVGDRVTVRPDRVNPHEGQVKVSLA
ncbi:MAG: RNB domain-containing ribonuclease [Desulfobacteraceae bacterium]